jgi:hypothetical protein
MFGHKWFLAFRAMCLCGHVTRKVSEKDVSLEQCIFAAVKF